MIQTIRQKQKANGYNNSRLVGDISARYYKEALKQKDEKQRLLLIQKAKDWDRRRFRVKKAGEKASELYKKACEYIENGDFINGEAYLQKAKAALEWEQRRRRKAQSKKMAEFDQELANRMIKLMGDISARYYEDAIKIKDKKRRLLLIQKAKDWDRRRFEIKKVGEKVSELYKRACEYIENGDLINGETYFKKAKTAIEWEQRRCKKAQRRRRKVQSKEMLGFDREEDEYKKLELYINHGEKVSGCSSIISRAEIPLIDMETYMKKVETIYRTCHCGSPLCPNCEKRKADKNFKTTLNDFKAIKEIIGNYMIIFFVLTVPNCSIYDLDSEKREILKSAKFFIKSYGDRVVYANRRFEFTPGKEKDKDGKLLKMRANQHVNVTMVYSLDDMRFDNMSMFNHTEVLKRWRVACGNDPSIKDVFFEVIPEEDLHEVIKYTVKSSDILGKGVDYYAAVLDFAVKTKGERSFLRSGSMIKKINAVKKNNKESDKEAETKILVPFTSFEWNEKKVDYTEIYKEWWSLVRLGSVCDTQRYRLDPDFGSKFYEQEAILDSA